MGDDWILGQLKNPDRREEEYAGTMWVGVAFCLFLLAVACAAAYLIGYALGG